MGRGPLQDRGHSRQKGNTFHNAPPEDDKDLKHFNFFKLPRELRDAIYDYATGIESSVANKHADITISLEHGPILALLLVCRQFKNEYESQIARSSIAVFIDRPCNGLPTEMFLPSVYQVCSRAEMELRLSTIGESGYEDNIIHNASVELNGHTAWIKYALRRLNKLAGVQAFIYLAHEKFASPTALLRVVSYLQSTSEFQEALATFMDTLPLSKLDIVSTDYKQRLRDREERLRCTWVRGQGWVDELWRDQRSPGQETMTVKDRQGEGGQN